MSEASNQLVVLEGGYDSELLEASLSPGVTVCFEGLGCVFAQDGDEAVELTPDEHPDYVEVGSIHGRPALPEEADIDGDEFLKGRLGRIGDIYFEWSKDPLEWEWRGRMASDETAIDYVCGADFDFRS